MDVNSSEEKEVLLPLSSSDGTYSKNKNSEIHSVEWRKIDEVSVIIFHILSLLSIGTLPLLCFFVPTIKLRMRSYISLPEFADYAIVTVGRRTISTLPPSSSSTSQSSASESESSKTTTKNSPQTTYIADVYHYENSREHIVSVEVNTIRYCGSSVDKQMPYALRRVPFVPKNFVRFLHPSRHQHIKKTLTSKLKVSELMKEEKHLLHAQYGSNCMYIPETSTLEIILKHALSPFYLFQYFAVIVWMLEPYYIYASLIAAITIFAIYITVEEEIFNLERLRVLAGAVTTIQKLEDIEEEENVNENDGSNINIPLKKKTIDLDLNSKGMTLNRTIYIAPDTGIYDYDCDYDFYNLSLIPMSVLLLLLLLLILFY